MATHLLLIAHGETIATRRAAFAGNEGLDVRGLQTARAKAAAIDLQPARASSSPAAAARETAEALGFRAEADHALRDLDVGRWSGRALSEVADDEPDEVEAWMTDPTFAGHGGESIEELIRRTAAWLNLRRAAKGITVAVTHAAVVRAAVLATLNAPPFAFWRIDAAPLEHVALSTDGRRWSLRAGSLC